MKRIVLTTFLVFFAFFFNSCSTDSEQSNLNDNSIKLKSGSCILGGGTSFLESSATSSSPFFGDRVTFTWQNNFALSTLNNYIFKIEVMDYQGNGPALAFSKEFITDYYEGTLAINRSNLSDISGYNPASFQWRLVMKGYNKTTGNLECETYTVWHIQSF